MNLENKEAGSGGGFELQDAELQSKLRSAGKEIIWRIGQKILSGNFNLTSIAFPIRCCAKYSLLQAISNMTRVFPYYLNAAAYTEDPLERMKLIVTSFIALLQASDTFDKPLNPILGETYSWYLPDGTIVYFEQTSHHPPIAHLHIKGPEDIYELSMYSGYSANGYLNSVKVNVFGSKWIKFKDGSKVTVSNFDGQILNILFGSMTRQIIGTQTYEDETNQLKSEITTGTVSGKEQDYFTGTITKNGEELSQIYGNYNGFIEIDGERYWDIREHNSFDLIPSCGLSILPSDSRKRIDIIALETEDENSTLPQENKEKLENDQRYDAALRKKAQAAREKDEKVKFLTKDMLI